MKRGWKQKLPTLEVDVYESTPDTTPTTTPSKLDLPGGPNFDSPSPGRFDPNSGATSPSSEVSSPNVERRRSSVRFDLPPEQNGGLLQRRRSRGN